MLLCVLFRPEYVGVRTPLAQPEARVQTLLADLFLSLAYCEPGTLTGTGGSFGCKEGAPPAAEVEVVCEACRLPLADYGGATGRATVAVVMAVVEVVSVVMVVVVVVVVVVVEEESVV